MSHVFIFHSHQTFPDCSKDAPFSDKRLSRMIGDRIVHNDKLAWSPPEGTLVPVHEARQILHDVCWQAAAISKYDCLSRLVP